MTLGLLTIILCYLVSTSLAKYEYRSDRGSVLERRTFEEFKKYVSTNMKAMTEIHARDIQGLKELIDDQGRQIKKLESDNLMHISVIRKLELKINTKHGHTINDINTDQKHSEETVTPGNTDESNEHKAEFDLASAPLQGRDHTHRIRRAYVNTEVAFFASMTSDIYGLGQSQNVAFQNVITNVGNAYNRHTGTFMAPVAGTFVFSATLAHNHNLGPGTWGYFMVNGKVVAKLSVRNSDDDGQTSQTIVVNLQKGGIVSVQNTEAGRSLSGDRYSSFAGFLLYENFQ